MEYSSRAQKLKEENDRLEQENKKLRECVEFYGNKRSYEVEVGRIARKTLEELKQIAQLSAKEDKGRQMKTIKIDDVEYVRNDLVSKEAPKLDGLPYVIIRTYSAGVHAGYLKSRDGKEVELLNSRRFYQWYGSSTLSQFAQSGTSKPEKCKFPEAVNRLILTEAIEILYVTEKAKATIDAVAVWKS